MGEGVQFEVSIFFRYVPQDSAWEAEASSQDPLITLGTWRVHDDTRVVTPVDSVAQLVATPGIACAPPDALLSATLTPPVFQATVPTPSAVLVTTPEEAALRVWVEVYGCYDHFPDSDSFSPYAEQPGQWTVEGKSDNTQYGLWRVSKATGDITPVDQLAIHAAETCPDPLNPTSVPGPVPLAVNAEQAQIRVWIAVYNCFGDANNARDPRPTFENFTALASSPQEWIVEGRRQESSDSTITLIRADGSEEESTVAGTDGANYGLWFVATDTGAITSWDDVAKETETKTCYQPP